MKKAALFVLILILLTSILPFTAAADDSSAFTVSIINSRQKSLTQDTVLIQNGAVYMTPQSLCNETGFTVSQSGRMLAFSRASKTVEVDLDTSLIIFGGICDSLSIIEKDGQLWLSMEKMLHFLNARCLFTDGTLIVHAAAYTVDEMVAAFMPIMTNGYNKKNVYEHASTGQTVRAVISSWLWDLVRHPVKQLYSVIDKDYSDMFVDMVRADEHSDMIYDVFKDADTHISFANKLISFGQKYPDAMPDILKRFGDIDAVKSITSGLDQYSQLTDVISMDDLMDATKYIGITYTQNYAYTDAVKYGFVAPYERTFEKKYSKMYTDAKKVVRSCEEDKPTMVTVYDAMSESIALTILESAADDALTAASMPISLIRKTADYAMDIAGFNDANAAFSDMQDLSKFQNFSFDTFFNAADEIMTSPLNADEDRILELKYSGLLYIRVAMMYDQAVGVSTIMLERQFVELTKFADEDILLDDLGYMPEYNINVADMLAWFEGSGISPVSDADTDSDSAVDSTSTTDCGNTSGNIANGGIAAESDGWIYYRDENSFLYRMKNDGSEETRLTSDDASYINVVGDWVYYIARNDRYTYGSIVCVQTDGTERTVLLDGECTNLIVANGWVYFLQDGRIFRMNLDGLSNEQLPVCEEGYVQSFWVEDDTVVYYNFWRDTSEDEYMNHLHISRMNVDGSSYEVLDTISYHGVGEDYCNIQVLDGVVYYLWDGPEIICMVPIEGGTVQEIHSDDYNAYYCLNVMEREFFCFGARYLANESMLLRLNTDGNTLMELCSFGEWREDFHSLCITTDWLFYETGDGVFMTSATDPQQNEYLIPKSNSRYITEADLEGFDAKTARLARNEIFARYGYTFTDATLQAYFDGQSWYKRNPNVNKDNPPQLNTYEEQNISVIKGYEEWLDNSQSGMPILENALYDYPIISLGHWKDDSISEFVFNEMVESDNGYIVTCDIMEYTEEDDGLVYSYIVDTKQLSIAKDVAIHCISAAWSTKYDYYEEKTFEEFLNEGSSYGIWPDFYADIRGNRIVEMAEVYTP